MSCCYDFIIQPAILSLGVPAYDCNCTCNCTFFPSRNGNMAPYPHAFSFFKQNLIFSLPLPVLHILWAPYTSKCPGDPIVKGLGVPMIQKQDSKLTKNSLVVSKTWRVNVTVTDGQSWNSSALEWFLIWICFHSAIKPMEQNALWPRNTYIHGHVLLSEHGVPAVPMQLSTCQCFVLTWGLSLAGKQ